MKKFLSMFLTIALVLSSFSCLSVMVSAEGETGDIVYTEVRTVDDLYNVRNNLTGNYILMNDIDLTEATYIDGAYDFMDNGWNPIGSGNEYAHGSFSGIFDGNGYEIKGLRIDVKSVPAGAGNMAIGLFAKVTGIVKNLTVSGSVKASVTNATHMGAIAGYMVGGTVENCHSKCDVESTKGSGYVGGIVGIAYGSDAQIVRCSSHGNIKSNQCAGGVLGYAYDTVSVKECYNVGNVSASTSSGSVMYSCGGIVGHWEYSAYLKGYIENCYNTGNLSGYYCAGIVGYNNYKYSSSSTYSNIKIVDCYNRGKLSGSTKNSIYCPSISKSSYQSLCVTVITSYYTEGAGASQDGAAALNEVMMQNQNAFTGFDFDSVWIIDTTCVYPYPQLINNRQSTYPRAEAIVLKNMSKTEYYINEEINTDGGVIVVTLFDGSVYEVSLSEAELSTTTLTTVGKNTITVTYRGATTTFDVTVVETPFNGEAYTEVWSVDDLYNVRNNLTGNYLLMNDIDLTEATSIDGKYDFMDNGWNPIGSNNVYGYSNFSGIFDGNGYEISGLRMDITTVPSGTGAMYLGLFARVSGTVKNLTVSGSIKSNVSKDKFVGAFAGELTGGSIENCHSYCEINVTKYNNNVGGIVGKVFYDGYDGSVSKCTNNKTLFGEDYVGGIVGYIDPKTSISQCYNIADLSGSYSGGIVGFCNLDFKTLSCEINSCYNIGSISGTSYCSGIVGYFDAYNSGNRYLYIEDCYNIGSLINTGTKTSISACDWLPKITTCYYLEGLGTSQTGATALNDAMMQEQNAYTGFDFENTWQLDTACEYPYPQLKNNWQTSFPRAVSLTLKELPKTQYYVGDTLSVVGGMLEVKLVDGTVYEAPLSDARVSIVNLSTVGTKTVTVSYRGASTTYQVIVSDTPFEGEDYTEIYTVDDLYAIHNNLSGNYILKNDIDLSEDTSINGVYDFMDNGWNPLGSKSVYGYTDFSGIFDGNGYEISGLRIDVTTVPTGAGTLCLGFFSSVSGIVKNLTVSGSISSNVSYNKDVGAITARLNNGKIENCHSKCTINITGGSTSSVGGLVGYSEGTNAVITKCSNSNSVSGSHYVGGLIGYTYNYTNVSQSFNIGNLQGNYCGGLVGCHKYNEGQTIENCYNAGNLAGYICSGIMGRYECTSTSRSAPNIIDCYNIGTLSGTGGNYSVGTYDCSNHQLVNNTTCYYIEGAGVSQTGAIALNEQMMRKQIAYTGFDFDNIWVIDSGNEYPYPQLRGNRQNKNSLVESISIKTMPKTTYFTGEEIDVTGGVLTVRLVDGESYDIAIPESSVLAVDMSTSGTKTVTITYKGVTTTYDITVLPSAVSISVVSMPNKVKYFVGEELDPKGLVILATLDDGSTAYVDDYTLSYDTTVGIQPVTVTYGSCTTTFDVTYVNKTLSFIAVTKMPDKTTYTIGDSFDRTGMVVTATYDDGSTEEITDYNVSNIPNLVGSRNLIVSYGGKRVIIQVTVVEKVIENINFTEPTKIDYLYGEEFDPTGMEIVATYNNGQTEVITDYEIEGFDDIIGPGIVYIIVGDFSYEFIITVHVPAEAWVIVSEPNCTEDGLKVVSCTVCNDIAREEVIPALGHDHDIAPGKAATCTDTGLTEGRACKVCGEVEAEQTVIPALGHDYSTKFTVDSAATCENDGSKSRHCSRCDSKTDITVIPAMTHDYGDWVTTKPGNCTTNGERKQTCANCGDVKTEIVYAVGHNFSDWYSESDATCDNGGIKARVCSVCNTKETAPIDALGHVYSVVWTTDKTPTCTVPGSKSHHCNRCDAKTDITEIAPLGHNFGEWTVLENATCTSSGQKYRMCSVCYSEDIEEIKALGHTYNEWTIDAKADCENDGARHTNCTVCGTVVNETIKAYGHDYQSVFTVDVEATCTEAGSKSHHCSRCDSKTDVTVIQPLGHHISTMWTIDKDPTCESEGLKSHHCLRCDCVEDVTTIPVANHIYGKWYVVTPATMDTAGVRAHKCYNCEMTEEAELPKLLKYTATFVADGDVVATVDFPEDATEIEIPEVPHKDKFNGEWENFDIRNKNFTVNAVYTPIPANEVEGIKTGNTADYYASTGEVEVNLNVSAPSRTIVTTTTKTVPLDIVFVLDQSGSMSEYGRKDALKSAVRSFSNAILDDAKKYSVDHRIAVVGFASGNNYGLNYANTELLTSSEVRYDEIKNSDYADSLVSVNNNGALNNVITKAINAIDAEGATRADIGLEMATNIFANNPVTDNRQRVVVFLTDGVPTSYSNFEYNVANVAIQNAYQLKNTYDATVYSVGVFDRGTSADSKVNNFMNYVSSNYSEDVVMSKYSKETTENIGGYYLDVSDVSKLSDVFTSIVEETTTHTGRFTKATLKYTLTNNFSLTINQENAIRKDAVEKLGVTNEQISITRNDNGTTTIVISDVEPWASGTNYVIDFTFRATANGNTLKSGTYQVGTFESGVILENGEGYEAVFAPQSVDIGGTSGIAVFNINNLPYAINRLSSTTKVVAPATDFGADYNFIGWNVPNNLTLNNEARVFEAELLKNEYKLSWNIDGEITEVKYAVGDFITVPHVGNNSIGGAFVGWDMDIPETMPSENLTITAIYDAHYHKYDVTKAFESCTEGGTLTYTCECGHTYTEEIAPCEHNWEVITASNNQNAIENAGSRCSVCGIKDSKALRLEGKSTYQMADASYNTATVELDYIDENGDKHQPDGNVEISVQLDEVFTNEIPADATATVYRVNDDGSRTILNSEQKGMQMTFTTDHFSTYEFEFTTGTQKYLFAQPKSRIDYANRVIFSDMRLARDFKDFVSYLAPATVDENADALGFMGTGTSITMQKDGVDTEYTVVINGDTNGDSVVDALDAAQVALVSNGQKTIDGAYKMAADNNQDDEISIEDYQAIVNKVVA